MVEASQDKKNGIQDDPSEKVDGFDFGKINIEKQDFLSQMKDWDDEDFQLSEDLIKGIKEELNFSKPSRIQKHAIPMLISTPYKNLIAQAKNGAGKTGAFVIGSSQRIDRTNQKIQVIVIANTNIMVTQIADIYKKLVKHAGITVIDTHVEKSIEGQVLVSTVPKLQSLLTARRKPDLSNLKLLVFDEADVYFTEPSTLESLQKLKQAIPADTNYALFSATYSDEVKEHLFEFVQDAQSIQMKPEKLSLGNIVQFRADLPAKKKVDFLAEINRKCRITQCIVFVNTKKFAQTVQRILKEQGLKANLVFGKGMLEEERRMVIQKFRDQEVNFLITTDLLSRGFDVSTVKLAVNFDVPYSFDNGSKSPDAETYLHRIGRSGRFGAKACAVTLMDREEDKRAMDDIVNKYSMQDKVVSIESADPIAEMLKKIVDEEAEDN